MVIGYGKYLENDSSVFGEEITLWKRAKYIYCLYKKGIENMNGQKLAIYI